MVDDVYDLNLRLSGGGDPKARSILVARLRELSPAELDALRHKCLSIGNSPPGPAMYLLGVCSEAGIGVPKDLTRAVRWHQKSADLGDSRAMNALGVCYDKGKGVAQDQKKGIYWYRRSADRGNCVAMCNLAISLRGGVGVPQDEKSAVEWYRRSADLGYTDAMCALGICFAKGVGVPKDEDGAREWFRKADTWHARWCLGSLAEDPITKAEYYCRALVSAPSDQQGECRHGITQLFREHEDIPVEILQRWILQRDETVALDAENRRLRAENEALRTEIDYRPGGAGFDEARRDFESRSRTTPPSDGSESGLM